MNTETTPAATPSTDVLLKALAGARLLILEMGHKLRYLDEDNVNVELWSNDGAYVPDDRFRALDALVPAELKTDLQDEAEATPPESYEERGQTFVVVQQGDGEVFIHASDTREDADAFRVNCKGDGYETSDVIEVPAALAAHGEDLYELLEAVAGSALALG